MEQVIAYLIFGAVAGCVTVFVFNKGCPTNGEIITMTLVGAVSWPLGVVLGVIAALGLTAEKIAGTEAMHRFKRWLAKPVCKKVS